MNVERIKFDFKFIILNCLVNKIPSWKVRRFFYMLCKMKIGKESRIGIGTVVLQPQNIVIGERTIVNENCHLDGRGGLTIGNDVSISNYTKIITASHILSSDRFEYQESEVEICDNVWIGSAAIILDKSCLEEKCVIGAGCVFKGIGKSNMVYAGNPSREIKCRNLNEKYRLSYHPYFR